MTETDRRTKLCVLATLVAWVAVTVVAIVAFGVVLGAIAGVWGVPIVVILGAGAVQHHRDMAAVVDGDDVGETTLDVHAERELQIA